MLGLFKQTFGNSSNLLQLIREGAVIVDVRSPLEFDSGHIKGSKNIPLEALRDKLDELKALNKPVITVCQSGMRSYSAQTYLQAHGFKAFNGGSWSGLNNLL